MSFTLLNKRVVLEMYPLIEYKDKCLVDIAKKFKVLDPKCIVNHLVVDIEKLRDQVVDTKFDLMRDGCCIGNVDQCSLLWAFGKAAICGTVNYDVADNEHWKNMFEVQWGSTRWSITNVDNGNFGKSIWYADHHTILYVSANRV